MTRDNNQSESSADLTVEGIPQDILGFISAQYTEIISGVLPRLVADFLCPPDKFPLGLEEVTLNLRVESDIWELKANIDDFTFSKNLVTIFFTLAPKEFYFISKSSKFKSPQEVLDRLYFGKVESDLTDNKLVELNQVATTDYKFLNNILRSFNSPSVFAYTLNSLNLKNLDTKGFELQVDPEKVSYYIDDREKDYTNDKLLSSTAVSEGVMSNNSFEAASLLEWSGIKLTHNSTVKDLIENVVSNTLSIKGHKLSLRLSSQKNLLIKAGDIVKINVPDIDLTRFLVVERLAIIGSEIKFNYKLKGID